MFIQIHTDSQIESNVHDADLEARVRERLGRFEDRLTHVQVHVSDANGRKGGNAELKCTLEARINGMQPVAVADHGATVGRAVAGAADKAARALDHSLGRLSARKGH